MSRVSSRSVRAPRRVAPSPAVAGFRPAGAALAIAAAFVLQPQVHAQPAGGHAIHGQASFTTQGSNLLVTTRNGAGTNHSAINWQSFSVPGGSLTHFQQPTVTSTSINRVLGHDPSAIFGTLSSNGRLVLVNPNGIAVGAGAVVDTNGFTASTLRMTDADAMAGRLRFSGGGGPLTVDGRILARSGDIVLVAPQLQVGAQGVLESQDGATLLAAGQKVEITGRGLEGIHLEVQAGDRAVNLGTLKGDAVGVFAQTLRHSGLVQAQAVRTEGGKVVLQAIGGDALVDGSVTASKDRTGGSIDVLGARVALLAGAQLDASGADGGGSVRVGGDYQGANAAVPNAAHTHVDAAAVIRADATQSGDGGRVIVWADEVTRMHGQISARGGAQGGDGGFAEVSGKQYLEFTGRADLRAPTGSAGTLLLDPNDIVIEVLGPTGTAIGPVFSGGTGPTKIKESDLEAQLANSSVLVATGSGSGGTGRITIADGVNVEWTTNNAFGLQADADIDLQGSITGGANSEVSLRAFNGGIVQNASTSTVTTGSLKVEAIGGSVVMEGANMVDRLAGTATGTTSNFSFRNGKDLAITTVGTPYGGAISGASAGQAVDIRTTSGNLTVRGFNDVRGGSVRLQAAGAYEQESDADVQAIAGDVVIVAGGSAAIGTQPGVEGWATTAVAATGQVSIAAQDIRLALPMDDPNAFSTYVTLAGDGGVQLESTVGNIDFGASTDVATLSAPVLVNAKDSMLGQVRVDTGGSSDTTGAQAAITITAGGDAGFGRLYSGSYGDAGLHGGNISITAGGDILGDDIRTASNAESSVGGNGGKITLAAGGAVAVSWMSSAGTSHATSAGSGGDISVQAGNGIRIDSIDSRGGHGWDYYGYSAEQGGAAGKITLTATAGDIEAMHVYAVGGDGSSGQRGGDVTLTANTGNVIVTDIWADGGYGAGTGGTGGDGGKVAITAGGNIVLTPYEGDVVIESSGGYSGYSGGSGTGGAGGTVELRAGGSILLQPVPYAEDYFAASEVSFSAGAIAALGGGGDRGGRGGTAFIEAGGTVDVGYVVVYGGWSDTDTSTPGGRGGDIHVRVGSGGIVNSALVAEGGGGAYAATGGPGGQGGTIKVESISGDLILAETVTLHAGGGYGGDSSEDAVGGPGGAGGTIEARANGGAVRLRGAGLFAHGGGGGYDSSGSFTGPSGAYGTFTATGSSVEVEAGQHVEAIWNNSASVNVRGTSVVSSSGGSFRNAGELVLHDASQMAVQDLENTGTVRALGTNSITLQQNLGRVEVAAGATLTAPDFISNAGTTIVDGRLDVGFDTSTCSFCELQGSTVPGTGTVFRNEAGALLAGSGTLSVDGGDGGVDNHGSIAPGGEGSIGTLTLQGHLAMQSGSRLLTDLLSASSHDILQVTGTAVSGGSIGVNYLPGTFFLAGTVFPVLQASLLDATTLPTVTAPELAAVASGPHLNLVASSTFPAPPPPPPPPPPAQAEPEIQQVNNQVITFAQLFVQEALQQQEDEARENAIGRDDIVVTDTGCKPS